VLLVPGEHLLRFGGVEHDVRKPDRDGLALLDLAVLPVLDVGGDLDGPALDVEKRKPYPPPGVCSTSGSLTSWTPAVPRRAASSSTDARSAAP
jgi:hypothetical protein